MSSYLLLMMGGSGTRFGADIPKQFVKVSDKPIFSYIVEKYEKSKLLDGMVIVCHSDWVDYTNCWVSDLQLNIPFEVVAGGSCRSESVKNGLAAVSRYAKDNDVVLIHDATHPYVDEDGVSAIVQATEQFGGATLGECQYDTVYRMDPETGMMDAVIPRETVVSGANPEAFLFGKVWPIYKEASLEELERFTSAGALALAYEIPMKVVPTNLINLKITYRHDMEVFQKLFHDYYF